MSSAKATSMAELMAKHTSPFVTVHKGDMVKGVITKLTPSEILLDINAKTEAVVLEKDRNLVRALMSMLKVGDTVDAQVLNPESETGNTVVSLRRFIDEKLWELLGTLQKDHKKVDVTVKAQTKGGYLVETPMGIDGFLPNSHVSFTEDTTEMVGKKLSVMIAESNRETRKLIVSQKPVLGQADFDALAKKMKKGEKFEGIVSHITSFGVFVNLPVKNEKGEETFLDGLIHISEISWDKVTDLSGMFTVGDTVEVVVTGVDTASKRIELSIKQLTADPYQELMKQFAPEQKVTGTVEKATEQGVVFDLGAEGVEGFVRKEKIPPTTKYEAGQKVNLTVTEVDAKKHRVYLTPVLLEKPLMYR